MLFGPRETIDVTAVAAAQVPWWNRTLTEVSDAVVRLAVMEGDFHWHEHEAEDEFFYVLEGVLVIETEDGPVRARAGGDDPDGQDALPQGAGPGGGADGGEGHGAADGGLGIGVVSQFEIRRR